MSEELSIRTEDEMIADVQHRLKERLKEVRDGAHYNDLAVTKPEKWMQIAMAVFRAKSILGTMRELGVTQHSVYKVKKQILDIRDDYKEFQINNIDANIDAIDDITAEELQKVREEGLELNHAKAIKELSVASQIMSQRRHKLSDGADKVVRVEQAKTPEELTKELEALFNEQTIEIEAEIVEDG